MRSTRLIVGLLLAAVAAPALAQVEGLQVPPEDNERRAERVERRAERFEQRDDRTERRADVPPPQVAPVTPQAAEGALINRLGGRPDWRRDRDGDSVADRRNRDRDGDGVPNWRDRDRDGDGIRNRRDADRNNDGRVDRRYDWDRDGRVDRRRYDWDRNGNINSRFGRYPGWDNRRVIGRPSWNRDWRQDRRYDWQRYRSLNRGFYRLPRYQPPYGWHYGYQRFSIGIFLNSGLFGRTYWLDDPFAYRLPPAYPPYRWVRYYDDALLVDTRDGYVVDVIYDVFW